MKNQESVEEEVEKDGRQETKHYYKERDFNTTKCCYFLVIWSLSFLDICDNMRIFHFKSLSLHM